MVPSFGAEPVGGIAKNVPAPVNTAIPITNGMMNQRAMYVCLRICIWGRDKFIAQD